MTAVAVWDHVPDADALLEKRVASGWRPTPTRLQSGPAVLGHACRLEPAPARGHAPHAR